MLMPYSTEEFDHTAQKLSAVQFDLSAITHTDMYNLLVEYVPINLQESVAAGRGHPNCFYKGCETNVKLSG